MPSPCLKSSEQGMWKVYVVSNPFLLNVFDYIKKTKNVLFK